jgi:26S proteasome regulatory subunit T5
MSHVRSSRNRQNAHGQSVSDVFFLFVVVVEREDHRCAAATGSTFLKLAGPQLVQMFIGDGAKLVRDAFALAKEKSPAVIFIDELDAIGTRRFDSEVSGDREVQRTMLELLNQLDGFEQNASIKG